MAKMSLVKQLWIAVVLTTLLAFVGSFSISVYTTCRYFEEQLRLKNIDNANSLALVLSQVEKEPVLLQVIISTQFDTGHYKRIELVDPKGKPIVSKIRTASESGHIPKWFRGLAPLNVEPGVAQVQDGWKQFGTLYVESAREYAQGALWKTTIRLFVLSIIVGVITGLVGTILVRIITRPLDDVVEQAEALAERRFIKSRVPRTLEFAKVVIAMNSLCERIQDMLGAEGRRLEELLEKIRTDEVTGLWSRNYFISTLKEILADETRGSFHLLVIIRILDLQKINQTLGYIETNRLLRSLGNLLQNIKQKWENENLGVYTARLKGSDFAIFVENIMEDAEDLARAIEGELIIFSKSCGFNINLVIPHAAGVVQSGEDVSTALSRIDNLLAIAERRYETACEIMDKPLAVFPFLFRSASEWQDTLSKAIEEKKVTCNYFPVVDINYRTLHDEAMMRVILNGQKYTAGSVIHWGKRLGILHLMDIAVLKQVLTDLARDKKRNIAVNLDIDTLKNAQAILQLTDLLKNNSSVASRLCIEISEQPVLAHLELFLDFCRTVSHLGCSFGLDRAGLGFATASSLQEAGLNYLKISQSLISDVLFNRDNQAFLRSLVILAHSVGIKVIAEGIESQDQVDVLKNLGVDGVTGRITAFLKRMSSYDEE